MGCWVQLHVTWDAGYSFMSHGMLGTASCHMGCWVHALAVTADQRSKQRLQYVSIPAIVNILRKQFFQTLCLLSRKGSSSNSPPSCTIHHTSMFPLAWSELLGNQLIPLGTSTASSLIAAIRIRPGAEQVLIRAPQGPKHDTRRTNKQVP